ncbi:MAG: hypothetical protein JXR22_12580, partial [Prolixibacteraceae bacterium]|nr:hypothetical protein [Prolixibacteraceae bacterium]
DAKNWKQVEDLTPFDLCFGLDEHVGFQPSADYLILYSQCLEAIKELIPSETKVYTSNELRSWLNKFKSQYLEVGKHFYYFKFSEFKKLYEALQFLIQRLVHHPEVKRALSEYHDLGHYSPIDWYRNYERLFYERVLCFDQVFDKIDFEKRILQMGTTSASYYFTGDDFFDLVDFNEIYTNPNP